MRESPLRNKRRASDKDTIEIITRSIVHRDPLNGRVLHVRVMGLHGGPHGGGQEDLPGQVRPITIDKEEQDFLGLPLYEAETIIGYSHFVLIRCDLSTSGREMKSTLAKVRNSFDDHGEKTERTLNYLVDEIDEAKLEDSMEAADDRWVDQLSIVETFTCSRAVQACDVYGACLKELLAYTNASSGMVVAIEYVHADEGVDASREALEYEMSSFENRQDNLRVVINAYSHEAREDAFWLISGVAQTGHGVEPASRIRLRTTDLPQA